MTKGPVCVYVCVLIRVCVCANLLTLTPKQNTVPRFILSGSHCKRMSSWGKWGQRSPHLARVQPSLIHTPLPNYGPREHLRKIGSISNALPISLSQLHTIIREIFMVHVIITCMPESEWQIIGTAYIPRKFFHVNFCTQIIPNTKISQIIVNTNLWHAHPHADSRAHLSAPRSAGGFLILLGGP